MTDEQLAQEILLKLYDCFSAGSGTQSWKRFVLGLVYEKNLDRQQVEQVIEALATKYLIHLSSGGTNKDVALRARGIDFIEKNELEPANIIESNNQVRERILDCVYSPDCSWEWEDVAAVAKVDLGICLENAYYLEEHRMIMVDDDCTFKRPDYYDDLPNDTKD